MKVTRGTAAGMTAPTHRRSSAKAHVRARTRWPRLLGLALIAGAVALLGSAGWELWGTNWVSERAQASITGSVQRAWTQGAGRHDYVSVPQGRATALIRIPRFGKKYVVPVLEGTDAGVLAAGFGHFPDSAAAGAVGNYALAAHRITHGEPLRRMPELRRGDKVIVETRTSTYTYVLDTGGSALIVDMHQTWVTDPLPTNPERGGIEPAQLEGQRLITLTTCSELFHTDNRMVAFGHLLTIAPRS